MVLSDERGETFVTGIWTVLLHKTFTTTPIVVFITIVVLRHPTAGAQAS